MTDPSPRDPPSAFVEAWVPVVARDAARPARALDIAMGRGRHTRLMAVAGFDTFGVDVNLDVVRGTVSGLSREGLVVLYETFTERQRAHGRGPTSPHHLLAPGELAEAFPTLETIFYEEVDEPEAVARLAARRRSRFS